MNETQLSAKVITLYPEVFPGPLSASVTGRALEKKIRMFYEALQWDMPVNKINTLERFF